MQIQLITIIRYPLSFFWFDLLFSHKNVINNLINIIFFVCFIKKVVLFLFFYRLFLYKIKFYYRGNKDSFSLPTTIYNINLLNLV